MKNCNGLNAFDLLLVLQFFLSNNPQHVSNSPVRIRSCLSAPADSSDLFSTFFVPFVALSLGLWWSFSPSGRSLPPFPFFRLKRIDLVEKKIEFSNRGESSYSNNTAVPTKMGRHSRNALQNRQRGRRRGEGRSGAAKKHRNDRIRALPFAICSVVQCVDKIIRARVRRSRRRASREKLRGSPPPPISADPRSSQHRPIGHPQAGPIRHPQRGLSHPTAQTHEAPTARTYRAPTAQIRGPHSTVPFAAPIARTHQALTGRTPATHSTDPSGPHSADPSGPTARTHAVHSADLHLPERGPTPSTAHTVHIRYLAVLGR